jgi:hypothetical protein
VADCVRDQAHRVGVLGFVALVVKDPHGRQPERRLEPPGPRGSEQVAVKDQPGERGAVPVLIVGTVVERAVQRHRLEDGRLQKRVSGRQSGVDQAHRGSAGRRRRNRVRQTRHVLEIGELVAAEVGLRDRVEQGHLVKFGNAVDDLSAADGTGDEDARSGIGEGVNPAAAKLAHTGLGLLEPVGADRGVLGEPEVDVEGQRLVTVLVEPSAQTVADAITRVERPEAVDRVEEVLVAGGGRALPVVAVLVRAVGVVLVEVDGALGGPLAVQS